MEFDEQRQGAVTVLRPRGPVAGKDGASLVRRATEAHAASRGRLVVDASEIAFADSAGL